MKLDRNINPDGKGKYALINLRTNTVQWGGDDQFFVIKYKDEFAAPALRAYSLAVAEKVWALEAQLDKSSPPDRAALLERIESLSEYAKEIEREAAIADQWPSKKIPD